MAASQRGFRKEIGISCVLAFCLITASSFSYVHGQSTTDATTEDVTTENVTTDTVTTPTIPPTPAPTQAQTTPAATSLPQTAFSENTDLGPCPCDMTANGCDVNCCCDTECSVNDRLAFSFCLPSSYLSKTDDRVCFKQDVIIIENTPYESNTSVGGLFCVYFDNYGQRNYYNIPDIITAADTDRLATYISRYAGPSFQQQTRTDPRQYPDIYKSGATIHTVFENSAVGVLGLPTTVYSSVCDDNNPAAYLIEETSTCTRDIVDLGASCETALAIKASTYYMGFKVVVTPSLFARFVPPSNVSSNTSNSAVCDQSTVDNLYNNSCVLEITPQSPHMCISSPGGIPQHCNYTTLPQPRYDPNTGECSDVVTQVEYTITTNGTWGIAQVNVRFVFTTLLKQDLPVSQTFITNFKGIKETDPVERSGNPGYVVGKPVRAGQLVRQNDPVEAIILLAVQQNGTRPEDNSLTILKPSLSGDCDTGTGGRTNVVFGEDMRSGCFVSFNMTDMTDASCQRLQQMALLALWPYSPDPPQNWSVATFGNSDPQAVGDWVTILVQNAPRTPVAGNGAECIDMTLGMHIQILYANVGSLSNPQAKIVGVSFVYENPQTVAFQCIGPYCQPGAESRVQRFEVVQSVSFIDVSQPAAEIFAEPPLFLAKVPYDFFYPFGLGSGTVVQSQTLLLLLLSVLSCLILSSYLCYDTSSFS